MASVGQPFRSPFASEQREYDSHYSKPIPILPSITASGPNDNDPMDVSQPPTGSMGPPATSSPPHAERSGEQSQGAQNEQNHGQNQQHSSVNGGGSGASQPVGAAAAAQQPKVVQTAFIHKLYK